MSIHDLKRRWLDNHGDHYPDELDLIQLQTAEAACGRQLRAEYQGWRHTTQLDRLELADELRRRQVEYATFTAESRQWYQEWNNHNGGVS